MSHLEAGDRVRVIEPLKYELPLGSEWTVNSVSPDGVWAYLDNAPGSPTGGYFARRFEVIEPDPRDMAQTLREQANAVESVAIAMRRLAFGIDNAVSAAEEVENLTANVQKNVAAMMEVINVD